MKSLFRTILFIINIIVCAAMLISGYGGMVSPTFSTIPGIALMVFPAVAVADILIIILDLVSWRRLAFLPLLVLLCCAPALWSFCPLNIGSKTVPEGYAPFKIMSYNVMGFADYKSDESVFKQEYSKTIGKILADDADIVCLQETLPLDPAQWWFLKEQADSIVKRYPYRAKGYGSLILWSKFELDTIAMPQHTDHTCSFQGARFKAYGNDITIYNIHLQSIGLNVDDKQLYRSITTHPTKRRLISARTELISKLSHAMRNRNEQALLLRQAIDRNGGRNIIVAGDFNDIETCHAERVIAGNDLHSVYTSVGRGPAITYYANRFFFNIDHILYGGDLQAISYDRGTIRSSDHFSVTALLALPLNP